MACAEKKIEDNAKDPQRCKCRGAVLKTYKLMSSDEPHHVAMEAAQRVYRYHHPEDMRACAALIVERWVYEDTGRYH